MAKQIKLYLIFVLVTGGLFLCLGSSQAQEQKMEKLEDLSRYYTPKYKDPNVYTTDPSEKKSLYHQGQPQLPEAMGREITTPQKEWSRPKELGSPQEFYLPPADVFFPFTSLKEEEEIEIEAKEGKVKAEAFAEKLMPIIESVTGKRPSLNLVNEEVAASSLVKPVTPTKEEEEKASEEELKGGSKEWELLFKKGRINLKPPSGTSEKDLQAIATQLVDLLGRGGEVNLLGPEGIEIKLK